MTTILSILEGVFVVMFITAIGFYFYLKKKVSAKNKQ